MPRLLVLALTALIATAPAADAALRRWTGTTGDHLWSTAANWDGDILPVNGDVLHFPAGLNVHLLTDELDTLEWVDSVLIDDNYTFGGQPLEIRNGITVASGKTVFFQNPVVVSQSQTWSGGGSGLSTFWNPTINAASVLTLSPGAWKFSPLRGAGTMVQTGGSTDVTAESCSLTVQTTVGEMTLHGGSPVLAIDGEPCTAAGCTTRVILDAETRRIDATGGALHPLGQKLIFTGTLTLGPGSRYEVPVTPVYGRRPADQFPNGAPVLRSPLHVWGASGTGHCVSGPGTVTLDNPTLEVIPLDPIAACTTLVIIDNVGSGPVVGTFAGLPEGATFTTSSGQSFRISYVGGTGNDVTVTAVDELPHCALVESDLSGDRKSDLVWRNSVTGENRLWVPSSDHAPEQFTSSPLPQVSDTDWTIVAAKDFDGDGFSDLLWRHAGTGENYLWRMSGASVLESGSINVIPDTNWKIAGTADFNGDGKADILWRHAVTGENYLYLMNGFTVMADGPLYPITDLQWTIAGTGDLNGDGRADIVWRHGTSGEVYAWLMNGFSVLSSGVINYVSDPDWTINSIADFDADRREDLLWRNTATGEVYLYLMNGLQIRDYGPVTTIPDLGWTIAATGDHDGDGRADLLWRHTDGSVYLYLMDGFQVLLARGAGILDASWTLVR